MSAPRWTVTDETTLEEVTAHLAGWLDLWEPFAAFFKAEPNGTDIQITDRTGMTGTLETVVEGDLTVTPAGFTLPLGIHTGRRYALSYQTADGHESPLSPLSSSSGPAGGAAAITIEIPVPEDGRVTTVRVWGAPDGLEDPLYLVGTCGPLDGYFEDVMAEASLLAATQWSGENPPPLPGTIAARVTQNGADWFELRLENGKVSRMDGLALDTASEGAVLNVTLTTSDELKGAELRLTLD